MKITDRQISILKLIIDEYIATATPVSSKEIKAKFLNDLSSATFRNEMAILENNGLIEKTHTSSGRTPTIKGYEFYEANILQPFVDNNVKAKLNRIFAKRFLSIEEVISESIQLINDTLHLPSVVTTVGNHECLKKMDLIELSDNMAIILIVSSSGNIIKNTISFNKASFLKDLAICIKIFNDRLIDTPFEKIIDKIAAIKPIIQQQVENYEFVMQEILSKVFNFDKGNKSNINGTKWLTKQPEFQDINKLQSIIETLEDSSIWQQIGYLQQETGKTTIIHGAKIGFDDLTFASTSVSSANNKHQISIVGPNRMNYASVKGLLDFLKNELEKKYNEKN